VLHQLLAATSPIIKAAQALGFGVGMGLGSLGAGIGIGTVFASMIQSVARQPELRG
jgi:F0F1-type ATP synthase membrane subunit c/vacuolar-type H+-ATPase subunit K